MNPEQELQNHTAKEYGLKSASESKIDWRKRCGSLDLANPFPERLWCQVPHIQGVREIRHPGLCSEALALARWIGNSC